MSASVVTPSLPLARLLLVGVVLPACFALLDQRLFAHHAAYLDEPLPATVMLSAYVVQIGLLGTLCARLAVPSGLRWTIYLWCWVLIDLQTFAAWSNSASISRAVSMLSSSLFAAQLGMALIWAVLGESRWAWRLPIAVLSVALIATPLLARDEMVDGDRAQLFLSQVVALLVICAVLRWQGFHLSWASGDADNAETAAGRFRGAQFGVRDVLVWMTSLAFLLAMLRVFDLLSGSRFARFNLSESISLISAGVILAMALVVALWASLGQGKARSRWTWLFVTCLVGGLLHFLGEHLFGYGGLLTPRSRLPIYADIWEYWQYQAARHWWQVAWVALGGGLLFAALLYLRGLGYQLSKAGARE